MTFLSTPIAAGLLLTAIALLTVPIIRQLRTKSLQHKQK
jgi:TctA family transporter